MGGLLATGSNDATVRLWDVAHRTAVATLSDVGNVFAVAFSPRRLAARFGQRRGGDQALGPVTGELVRTIRGESEQLRCLAFTPDGRNIVAAGKGKVVRIWDVATGQELLSLEGHQAQINALAFSPRWIDPRLVRSPGEGQALARRLAGIGDWAVSASGTSDREG